MTREEKEKFIRHLRYNLEIGADYLITDEDVVEIIKALEQEPCEDCVSRQAVLDAIDKWVRNMHVLVALPANEVTPLFESMHELPPITPQPKTGYWIDADGDNAICGCCNRLNHLYGTYCKHCGTKMINP